MVELLLAHGADSNSTVDSSGSAVTRAATPEIRALLEAHGGTIDPYDTSWIDEDDEVRRVAGDPRAAFRVGAAFTMVVGSGRRDQLERLLASGMRVPPVVTGCQTYLLVLTSISDSDIVKPQRASKGRRKWDGGSEASRHDDWTQDAAHSESPTMADVAGQAPCVEPGGLACPLQGPHRGEVDPLRRHGS
jgi:hypothetical protein